MALLLLAGPALLVVGALLLAPVLWLAGVSFIADGHFTVENYVRLFVDDSFAKSLWLTLSLAVLVTSICAVSAYVCALATVMMPGWARGLCLGLIALPFWTSVLVRTYAWLILLEHRGIVNNGLLKLGLIVEPLALMNNTFGTLIGMIHIMLPFVVFPLYSTLRGIDLDYMKAALVLGASPGYSFRHVFFPLSLPGLVAGSALVLVMSLGFYVTPALLGGGHTIVMSLLIERDIDIDFSWGPASATAMVFLVGILAFFVLLSRFVSVERILKR